MTWGLKKEFFGQDKTGVRVIQLHQLPSYWYDATFLSWVSSSAILGIARAERLPKKAA